MDRVDRVIRLSLLGVLVFLFCACSSSFQDASQKVESPAVECRVIQHTLGNTCVSAEPNRLVVLSTPTLGDALALGVKPVGAATYVYENEDVQFPTYLKDKVRGIEFIGNEYQPSLEKILLLNPDLIIGFTDLKQIYDKLEQIAPTVLFN